MKARILAAVVLAAFGVLVGWRVVSKRTEAATLAAQSAARAKAPAIVQVAQAVRRDVTARYEGVGTVESPFNVKLASKVTGRISVLSKEPGSPVRTGEVLARIDPSQYEAQVSSKQAALAEARARLAQAEYVRNPTDVSVLSQLRQQQADLASSRAEYNQSVQSEAARRAADAASVADAEGRIQAADAAYANAQAAITSAEANRANAQTKYDRTLQLYKQGFVAAQDVDDASTALAVQKAALDAARGQLSAATAQRRSAVAQRNAASEQARINATKDAADTDVARQKLRQSSASLELAQANRAQRPAYLANLAALRAQVDAAAADLADARSQLADTVLASPLDGFVTGRFVDPGSVVTAGQPVIAVQDLKQVWVTVSVPEEQVRGIAVGAVAGVRFDSLVGGGRSGRVVQVNAAADPQSRQFQVRVQMSNPGGVIKPGMFAHVVFETARDAGAVVVPREAVQTGPKGTFVVVVSNGTAHVTPVVTGAEDAAGIAIRSGIDAGDSVVVLSAAPVKDGSAIKVARPAGGSTK